MSTRRWVAVRRGWRAMLLLVGLVGAMAVTAPAAAHLGLGTSDPANGARLARAPQQITLTFTRAAEPVGSGFRLADAAGQKVATSATSPDGGKTWRVRPASLLASDRYRLSWKVVAEDAHIRSGTVSFEVVAPVAGASPEAPERGMSTSGDAGAEAAVAPSASASMDHSTMPGMGTDLTSAADAGMDGMPDESVRGPLDLLGGVTRWLSLVGVLVAVGALVVAVTTLVGSTGDVALATRVVRASALTAAGAAAGEGLVLLLALGLDTPPAAAAAPVARLIGGSVLAASATMLPRTAGGRRTHDVRALPPEPVPAGRGGLQLLLAPPVRTERVRAVLVRPVPAAAGVAAGIGSFLLDGHTTSVGPRWAMLPADAVHTLGASVWAGGVVLLACLLLVRARAGVPTGAGELAVRFSVPASAAAAGVAAAGGVMLLLITDRPSDLLTTPWGQVMTVKLALVGVVALLGYANNRYAVPALDAWQPHTARMLRRTVAVEAAVMVVVLLVTAVLVASGM